MMNFIKQALKSKTMWFMGAAAILPALEILGAIDVVAIVEPFACGVDAMGTEECTNKTMKIAAGYALVITTAGKILRVVTKLPLLAK